jgi:hypothetical protein
MPKIKINVTTEDGVVLDQFLVESEEHPETEQGQVALANEFRRCVDSVCGYDTEDV